MNKLNIHIKKLAFAGWFGVLIYILISIPDGGFLQFDVMAFMSVIDLLKSSPYLSNFLYKFNSVKEIWLNVPIMLICMFFTARYMPKEQRKEQYLKILCTVFLVEMWIMLIINPLLSKIITLNIDIVPEVKVWMDSTNRVVNESASLISRHVFTMFFYAFYFVEKEHPTKFKFLIWICAIVFSLPLFLNARHWLSDVVFSIWLSYSAVNLCKLFEIETEILRRLFPKHN